MERNAETHQTLLWGMGETHLGIARERLARKLGVEVETEPVKVAYRETITATAEAEGKYKKQTGGHGQFGIAFIRVEPLERGADFEWNDAIVGGAIPKNLIPAVEKGVRETMAHGGVFGFPVVDVRVTCFDGKFHSVDSSEMSFKMAGSIGFKEAMAKAGPILLEPVSELVVRRARGQPGRHPGRPQRQAGADPGRQRRGQRRGRDRGVGPDVGDPPLRDRPALDDPRPRSLRGDPLPLRPDASPPGRQGQRLTHCSGFHGPGGHAWGPGSTARACVLVALVARRAGRGGVHDRHLSRPGPDASIPSNPLSASVPAHPIGRSRCPPSRSPGKASSSSRCRRREPAGSTRPNTSVVVEVAVDGGTPQTFVLFAGSSPYVYTGFTGPLSTGPHDVAVSVRADLSVTTGTPTVLVQSIELVVIPTD